MKKILKKYIFSNKFVLENISRSCYGFSVAFMIAIIVAFVFRSDSAFNLYTICFSITGSMIMFILGIVIDNIRKDIQ
ncbi:MULTISPECIES: hypothetical protein [unclassified Campylobacter]|uniref:hypothetical protein n=1 Tax=unclassified Campylobacter TaxID=2593542 RepID=UPI001BDAF219|nr:MULTISPECIES: hypothetical protein [unclassified Campylobacter]MBT0879255.1 hypothetical protein [Campylobacter sp. 2018MI01]ULO03824.1 putative membrane protein [Campylobacter sp. RM12651]